MLFKTCPYFNALKIVPLIQNYFFLACFLRLLRRTAEMESKIHVLEQQVESLINKTNKKKTEDSITDEERLQMEALVPLPVRTIENLELLNDTLKTNGRYVTFLVSIIFLITFGRPIFFKLKIRYHLYYLKYYKHNNY